MDFFKKLDVNIIVAVVGPRLFSQRDVKARALRRD